jgi:hypothetical protein
MGAGGQHHAPALEEDPVLVWETGWAPGLVWTGAENLTPTGIQSLDHPACTESLY